MRSKRAKSVTGARDCETLGAPEGQRQVYWRKRFLTVKTKSFVKSYRESHFFN